MRADELIINVYGGDAMTDTEVIYRNLKKYLLNKSYRISDFRPGGAGAGPDQWFNSIEQLIAYGGIVTFLAKLIGFIYKLHIKMRSSNLWPKDNKVRIVLAYHSSEHVEIQVDKIVTVLRDVVSFHKQNIYHLKVEYDLRLMNTDSTSKIAYSKLEFTMPRQASHVRKQFKKAIPLMRHSSYTIISARKYLFFKVMKYSTCPIYEHDIFEIF